MKFEPYCDVEATFTPKRRDNLKPGVEAWIGRRGLWTWAGVMDEGEYTGQAMFMPKDMTSPFAWVPECDLSDVRILAA